MFILSNGTTAIGPFPSRGAAAEYRRSFLHPYDQTQFEIIPMTSPEASK